MDPGQPGVAVGPEEEGPLKAPARGGASARAGPAVNGASAPEEDGEGGRMTIYEHIAELRRRLVICIAAIAVAAVAGWFLYYPVLHFMEAAYRDYCHTHVKRLVTCNLVATTPTQAFLARLQLAFYLALAMAAPVWLWQLWRFITPGLRKREKQYVVPFVLSAFGLFGLGVTVAIVVWPKAIKWLISVGGTGITPFYTLDSYMNLYTLICLVFGAVFLYPIAVVFLMISGVVPTARWRKWRRPAIVVLALVAAIVTPSNDPFTYFGMFIPMYVLYEASIIVGRVLGK